MKKGRQASHIDKESSQGRVQGVQAPYSASATERLPRKRGEHALKLPDAGQEDNGEVLGNVTRPDVDQSSPVPKNEMAIHPANIGQGLTREGSQSGFVDQGKSPRVEVVPNQERQPRKRWDDKKQPRKTVDEMKKIG